MAGRTIQLRNVPATLQRRIEALARLEGLSISEYLLREISKWLERPTRQETLARLRAQHLRTIEKKPADMIREDRDSR
jgi:hypothetical protein